MLIAGDKRSLQYPNLHTNNNNNNNDNIAKIMFQGCHSLTYIANALPIKELWKKLQIKYYY